MEEKGPYFQENVAKYWLDRSAIEEAKAKAANAIRCQVLKWLQQENFELAVSYAMAFTAGYHPDLKFYTLEDVQSMFFTLPWAEKMTHPESYIEEKDNEDGTSETDDEEI